MSLDYPPPQTVESFEAEVPILPFNPLQAQSAYERRINREDWVAHILAVILVGGFFGLAFAALLGFVDLANATAATFLGTVMGYAIGKVDPIMGRYYHYTPTPPKPAEDKETAR